METKTPLQKVNRSQLIKLSHARSESGQAVVEYLLVLVITVAIAVGLLYQFNGSFARWATSYFGSYFACLLETGELPGIGGAGGDSGICSQLYENFSFAGGVPPSPRIGSGGSGGGRNRPQSPRPTPASEGSIDSRRSSSGGANYARVGGQNARRSGGGSGASTYGAQMGNSSKSSRTKLASKPTYTGSTESSLPSSVGSQNGGAKRIKISPQNQRFGLSSDKDEEKEKRIALGKKDQSQLDQSREEKIRIKKQLKKDEQDLEENEMTFGDFIRILIIAAIIIALVVLLGGQGLQISKSWD